MHLHQIKDWDEHYENAKSRNIERKSWCAVPNKRGLGYCHIMKEKDGPAIYGAFMATVLLASNQKRPRQGYLTDTGRIDGIPMTPFDISLVTHVPDKLIARMLEVCSGATVGWIVTYDAEDTTRILEGYHADPQYTSEGRKEGRKEATAGIQHFDQFWTAYPKKVAKGAARKSWQKQGCDKLLEAILEAVEKYKRCPQWQKDGGQYIPHPATWLNQGRWDDEPQIAMPSRRRDVAI